MLTLDYISEAPRSVVEAHYQRQLFLSDKPKLSRMNFPHLVIFLFTFCSIMQEIFKIQTCIYV